MVLIMAVCTLVLTFSSCHHEKITKWRCVPYEGCNIELIIDNESDLVYVTADYSGFIPPDNTRHYHFLFHSNTRYKKIGNVLRYIEPLTDELDSTGFVIISQSDESMDIKADNYWEDGDAASYYVTDYHFNRVL